MKSKISKVQVRAEAMRMAKELVKAKLRQQNIKISYVEANEITRVAASLLASEPKITERAKRRLYRRSK
jgi:hypothetical protein